MSLFSLILILGCAVLLSALINQIVRGVSVPLIQIALGVTIALCGVTTTSFNVDPELFLVVFIAPLLFDEARHVQKRSLFKYRRSILSLAVGLVFATALVVGFSVHMLEPSIPLTAAFALGASLGPTDAVAVSALSKRASLSPRQSTLLSGESLVNDASGVVSFQFAIAALLTGGFSLTHASVSFAVSFLGGLLLGALLGCAALVFARFVRSIGLEDTTFHVLYELMLPFGVFLLAEHVHVSGILAVVALGLVVSSIDHGFTPAMARVKIVSASVWKVYTFILNGIVFVLLGIQLPRSLSLGLAFDTHAIVPLALAVVGLSILCIGMRIVWMMLFIPDQDCIHPSSRDEHMSTDTCSDAESASASMRAVSFKVRLKDACIMALAGPKGAITLSIAFTLPYVLTTPLFGMSIREYLIFLAGGTILITLLAANFLLPILAPNNPVPKSCPKQTRIEILQEVIAQLFTYQSSYNYSCIQRVVSDYTQRIELLNADESAQAYLTQLRLHMLNMEKDALIAALEQGQLSVYSAYVMMRRLHYEYRGITHNMGLMWFIRVSAAAVMSFLRGLSRNQHVLGVVDSGSDSLSDARQFQCELLKAESRYVEELMSNASTHVTQLQMIQGKLSSSLDYFSSLNTELLLVARKRDESMQLRKEALTIEREIIARYLEEGRINVNQAQLLKDDVLLMHMELDALM